MTNLYSKITFIESWSSVEEIVILVGVSKEKTDRWFARKVIPEKRIVKF